MKRTDTPTLSSPLHAGDLINSLVWPRLLRAAGLALHPGRLGLAAGILVLIGIIASIPGLWLEAGTGPRVTAGEALGGAGAQIVSGVLALDHVSVAQGLWKFGVDAPTKVVKGHPWSVVIILVPVLLVWGVGGAAIARSAASEYSLREKTPWPASLGFGVSKAASLVGAKLTPLLIVGVVVGLLCVGGWVLLRFPMVQALGGLAYVLALGGGLVIVVVCAGYLLGGSMLVPAIACEGTDAIDAMQRVYAYAMARPARLLVYSLVLVIELVLVAVVLASIANAVTSASAWATTLLLPDELAQVVHAAGTGEAITDAERGWSMSAMAASIAFWSRLPGFLVGAYLISFYFSGGTLLYLMMRLVCDGQDPSELWRPGMPAGVVQHEPAETADEDDE
ncbi:MAG: hypothetical protein IPM33_08880 [Phycisphaerales bacterium]|nr:hypothetical protein [Phycisphaerales bacterium]